MKIKNLVWDWNGTIVNDAFLFVQIMNGLLEVAGLSQINLSDYKNKFCFPIQNYWRILGFTFTDETFNKMNTQFIINYKKKMHTPLLHPGIRSLFFFLKKKKINQFVVSASENTLLQSSVKYYNLSSCFCAVSGVNNLHAVGKDGVAFRVLSQYKLKKEETLWIGDTEQDFEIASSLGLPVVLVSFGHISKKRLIKTGAPVVSSIGELKNYISEEGLKIFGERRAQDISVNEYIETFNKYFF